MAESESKAEVQEDSLKGSTKSMALNGHSKIKEEDVDKNNHTDKMENGEPECKSPQVNGDISDKSALDNNCELEKSDMCITKDSNEVHSDSIPENGKINKDDSSDSAMESIDSDNNDSTKKPLCDGENKQSVNSTSDGLGNSNKESNCDDKSEEKSDVGSEEKISEIKLDNQISSKSDSSDDKIAVDESTKEVKDVTIKDQGEDTVKKLSESSATEVCEKDSDQADKGNQDTKTAEKKDEDKPTENTLQDKTGTTPEKVEKEKATPKKKEEIKIEIVKRVTRSSSGISKPVKYIDPDPRDISDDDDDIRITKEVKKDYESDIEMIEESDPLAISDADVKKAKESHRGTHPIQDRLKTLKHKDIVHKGKDNSNVIIIDTNSLLKSQSNLTHGSSGKITSSVSAQTTGGNTASSNIQTAIQAITGGNPAIQGLQSAYLNAIQQVLVAQGGSQVSNPHYIATLQQYYNTLGALQDDAYVIEAPSFIVPYVMEGKPVESIKDYLLRIQKEVEEEERKIREEEEKKKKEEEEKKKKEEEEEKKKVEEEKRKEEEKKKEEEEKKKEEEKDAPKDKENEKDIKSEETKPDAEEGKEEKMEVDEVKEEKIESTKEKSDNDKDESMEVDEKEQKTEKKESEEKTKEKEEKKPDEKDTKEKTKTKEKKENDDNKENKGQQDGVKEEEVIDLEAEKEDMSHLGRWEGYYKSALGKFFLELGLNHAQEFIQADLLKMQKRRVEKLKTNPTRQDMIAIKSLERQLNVSKAKNAHLYLPMKTCRFCSFKTECALVMERHLESPHMVNYTYKCNFCEFETRGPQVILFHTEAEHNVRGRLERAPAFFQCPLCPFEDNNKSKMTRHSFSCTKKFKADKNSELTDWEPPAKIPKIHRGRPNSTFGKTFDGLKMPNILPKSLGGLSLNLQNAISSGLLSSAAASSSSVNSIGGRGRGRPVGSYKNITQTIGGRSGLLQPMQGVTTAQHLSLANQVLQSVAQGGSNRIPRILPASSAGSLLPGLAASSSITIQSVQNKSGSTKSPQQPSISITPLPRGGTQSSGNKTTPTNASSNNSQRPAFVICEICDGYIKDLEQLRNHMNLIHKVKIHPKMIYNRPPLNCQKCQHRFFTDQGLERHLLGTHGLVTSSMQEAANKGKDAGRCPICGKVFQWKLLNHVSRDHKMTLKPAHLSYKCTVCTATFNMYRLFENHVYSAHSVVNKNKSSESTASTPTTPAKKAVTASETPLKINDEITIIPQPASKSPKTETKTSPKKNDSPSMSKEITITKVGSRSSSRRSGSTGGGGVEVISLDDSPQKKQQSEEPPKKRTRETATSKRARTTS